MKNRILVILLFFTTFVNAQEHFIQINGKTNVNSFKCKNHQFYFEKEAHNFFSSKLPNIYLKYVEFDCGNKMMNRDFQKILQADNYPYLHINFLKFTQTESESYVAVIEVTMVQKTIKYVVDFKMANGHLVGDKNVKFSDFNIVPPKKMGGLIVVKDDLDLVFNMHAKEKH